MLPLILGVAAAMLGYASGPLGAAALGLALGVLWKRLTDVTNRQASLTDNYAALRQQQELLRGQLLTITREAAERTAPAADIAAPTATLDHASAPDALAPPQARSLPTRPADAPPPAPAGGFAMPPAAHWIADFFTTGNIVAKVGMVIVFFGVAFLLKYATDRGMVPIEYRLMATAASALALLGVGWRLRHSRRDYAAVLQGGAVGLLYLTIFAAFRLYALLPAPLTFGLLLAVVAFSGALAVLQRAMSLAVIGTSGGFLAPILASTGAGSHVALFSYYAALNAGVLGIAWFQSWRFLNWLAFVFTFGIGFVWGQAYYQPALFATTEPFLVLFFLLFLSIAVLFAHRQPPRLRGYIDASLVFGTPAIAFAMQSVLVRDIPFARAYSAVAVSAVYLALARALSRRDLALRPLTDAFLALAAVFLILAVPLAFDGHATAAAWALEGAGLVWVGIRQQRWVARLSGAGLLLGAGIAFAVMSPPSVSTLPALNTRFLGGVAIALGSIIAGRLLSRATASLTVVERTLEWTLLTWGLLWWFGVVVAEVVIHVPARLTLSSALLAAAISTSVVALLARRWEWRAMMLAAIPLGPLLWVWVLPSFVVRGEAGPLGDLGWLAWLAVLIASYLLMFWFERVWPADVVSAWHAATAWLLLFLVTWSLTAAVRYLAPEAPLWAAVLWCAVPSFAVITLQSFGNRLAWPVRRFGPLYTGPIALAAVVASLIWVVWACGSDGSPAPLRYIPLVNPLELTQALGLLAACAWWKGSWRRRIGPVARSLVAAIAFLAMNAVVARSVHVYLHVPFDFDELVDSSVFQTGVSILWGVTAGVLMVLARLWFDRAVWMTGATLIGMLIVKLFAIDLGNVGGVARIVSFLATGILILLIGYVAPAPPKAQAT